jgi:hypothetical protein
MLQHLLHVIIRPNIATYNMYVTSKVHSFTHLKYEYLIESAITHESKDAPVPAPCR